MFVAPNCATLTALLAAMLGLDAGKNAGAFFKTRFTTATPLVNVENRTRKNLPAHGQTQWPLTVDVVAGIAAPATSHPPTEDQDVPSFDTSNACVPAHVPANWTTTELYPVVSTSANEPTRSSRRLTIS